MLFRKATHSYNELKSYMMANKLRVSTKFKVKVLLYKVLLLYYITTKTNMILFF